MGDCDGPCLPYNKDASLVKDVWVDSPQLDVSAPDAGGSDAAKEASTDASDAATDASDAAKDAPID